MSQGIFGRGLGRALRRATRGSRLLTVATAGALALLLVPSAASAQLAVDHVELLLDPQSASQRIGLFSVKNEGEKPVQALIRIEDWDRAEDGTNHWYPSGTVSGSCGHALQIFPASMQLAPGASQSVRVTLDSAITDRECWGAAIVETTHPRVVGGRSLLYVLRTAVKIYADSPGLQSEGTVAELHVAPSPAAADSGRPLVEAVFANTGERHAVAHGTVEFRRPDNSVAERVSLPDAYALPGASARVTALAPALPSGRYVALALFDYGGNDIAAAQVEYEVP